MRFAESILNGCNAVKFLRAATASAVFLMGMCTGNLAQASAEATPTPSATATPSPTPIPVTDIVTQADATTIRLQAIRAFLNSAPSNRALQRDMPGIAVQIEAATADTNERLANRPSLDELNTIERVWTAFAQTVGGWRADLRKQAVEFDKRIEELKSLKDLWQRSLAAITGPNVSLGNSANDSNNASRANASNNANAVNSANAANAVDLATAVRADVPDELFQRINDTIAAITEVQKHAEAGHGELLTWQTRVSDLDTRVAGTIESIKTQRSIVLSRLLVRDAPALWNLDWASKSLGGMAREAGRLAVNNASVLRDYAAIERDRFIVHGVIVLLLAAGLFWARSRVAAAVEKEPQLERSAAMFRNPIAAALLLSIFLAGFIYPNAPPMLLTALGAAALLPVVILLRRLVNKPLFIVLYVLVGFYFYDRVREVMAADPLVSRLLFLTEMLAAVAFGVWFLRSKRLASKVEAGKFNTFANIRKIVPIVLVVFSCAFLANAVGFVSLSNIIGNGVLRGAYAALILYTAVQVVESLSIFFLRLRLIAALGIVKANRTLIQRRIVRVFKWVAVFLWILVMLNAFAVRDPVFSFAASVFSTSLEVGAFEISVSQIVGFAVAVWIAFLVSRFIRFVLEEDVYPRMDLGGGVSYAISTVVHYVLLILGFMLGIAVLGVELSKFTVLVGAVGIGLGFGLQQIINNFVSGLILLFERPVKVGDSVQIGEHIGSLQHIGLRASVVRKVDGSDVIVPNSHLISEEVINWTMSDDKRRIDIPVGVAYGTDANIVIELLSGVTTDKPDVLPEPKPQVLFVGFGESSIDFELRAWTDNTDGWVDLRSRLVADIYNALNDADIEIPFPQRDLHLRSVGKEVANELGPKNS